MKVIGVVGAGTMGGGLAQKIATEDYHVIVVETTQEALDRGMKRIEASLEEAVQKKILSPEAKQSVHSRITPTTEFSRLKNADLVIEAVFENLQVKREVFQKIAQHAPPTTLIATNTSSYKVQELAEVTPHPERVLGLHYFFHPAKNKMVEIIGHPHTAPEVLTQAWSFNLSLGKTPINCADAYGFVVNRYFVPFVNEATRLLEEKTATLEEIEVVAKETFGIGMGPFELMNATGIPISLHAATTLGNAFGGFYTPCTLLRTQMESKQNWPVDALPTEVPEEKKRLIRDRLLGVTFVVVGQILDECVSSKEDCDLGARVALLWKKGPFQLMNDVGTAEAQRMVTSFCSKFQDKIPRSLEAQFKAQKKWSFSPIETKRVGKTAHIVLKRPEVMNPINAALLDALHATLNTLEEDPSVAAIHIESFGKAFVAGADLKFMLDFVARGDHEGLKNFISFGSRVYRQIDLSKKLVMAIVHGPAYGGGTELALTSDTLILSNKAFLCLPETGLGLLPGLGGTQRVLRFGSKALAKFMVYTGLPVSGTAAVSMGLAEYHCALSELALVAAAATENVNRLTKARRESPIITQEFGAVLQLLERTTVRDLLNPSFKLQGAAANDKLCVKAMEALKTKSPYALLLSEEAIDKGSRTQKLDEALDLERDLFLKLTQHPDALEGMKAFAEKRTPKFAPLIS